MGIDLITDLRAGTTAAHVVLEGIVIAIGFFAAGALVLNVRRLARKQFSRWALSPAEREIALILLKGLSHKEIAVLRGVNEATVRQQARAMYRKAGLSGRSDLAASFLEDLLGPRPGTP